MCGTLRVTKVNAKKKSIDGKVKKNIGGSRDRDAKVSIAKRNFCPVRSSTKRKCPNASPNHRSIENICPYRQTKKSSSSEGQK
jgi:hypothetical protein